MGEAVPGRTRLGFFIFMAKDPAFLFYPADWIGGTMGMTFEEKGAYMELLMLQFNRGHMNLHMINHTIGQLWVNIKDKFVEDESGMFYNPRLEEEKLKRAKFTESRRNNISGHNKHNKKEEKDDIHMSSHMNEHMNLHMVNINEDINNNIVSNKKKEKQNLKKPESNLTTYDPKEVESFTKFQNWILDNAPRVAKMKEPFTISQYLSLVKKGFTPEKIRTTLADMHNWTPLLTKNQSAYLTLTKWTKKDQA